MDGVWMGARVCNLDLFMADARNPCETERQLLFLVEKQGCSQEMMLFFPASAMMNGS